MRNTIGLILGVIVLILSIFASTYSWLIWKSNEVYRTGVNFSANGLGSECITYSTSQMGNSKLTPVKSKKSGYITTINISQSCGSDLYVDFKLKIVSLDSGLKDESFKYVLLGKTSVIGEGNFLDKRQGETITIATHQLLTDTPTSYRFYLWMDGNLENSDDMQSKNYEFDLNVSTTDMN